MISKTIGTPKGTFLSNLFFTLITQIFATVASIIILKIIATTLVEEGVGIFLLIKRFIAFAFPLITLNLGISMARFISFHKEKAEQLFFISVSILTIFCVVLLILAPFTEETLSRLLFGDIQFKQLLYPTIIFLYSNSFQILCMSYFRGKYEYKKMNWVNIFFAIGSIIGLIAFLGKGEYQRIIENYYYIYSIFMLFVNSGMLLFTKGFITTTLSVYNEYKSSTNNQWIKTFLGYGFYRLPSGFFMEAIFFIPIIIASNFMSLKIAAYIGLIVSIIRMVQVLGYPFNLLFLPKFSALQSSNDHSTFTNYSQLIIEGLFTFPLMVGSFFSFFSPELIEIWFGKNYNSLIEYMIFLGPSVGLFFCSVLIRGIIDGFSNYPYSNIITSISLATVLIINTLTIFFSWDLHGLTISLSVGLTSLGIASVYILTTKLELNLLNSKIIYAMLWQLTVFVALLLLDNLISNQNIFFSLFYKLLISIVILYISYYFFKYLRFEWIKEIANRL